MNKQKFSPDVRAPNQIGPYFLRGVIGEGAFSVVKLAYLQSEQKYYACKIVPRSRINTPSLEQRFEVEIRISQQMHHPGVVQLVDVLQDANNYYIVMEFCPNGELFQYIVDRKRLKEDEARNLIYQIFDTIRYIHTINVAHRDLKPENILLDQFGHLKISDFGLSKFVEPKNCLVSTPCGSPCYASPECISGKPYNGKTNDIWSCGVILFAMVTGQLPWTKRNQAQLFEQIKKGEYRVPEYLSRNCQNLIKGLLCVDTKARLTVQQAMAHPWFQPKPPQLPSEISSIKIVSLRKIDLFFNRVVTCDISETDGVPKNKSYTTLRFNGYVYLRKSSQNPQVDVKTNKMDEKSIKQSKSSNIKIEKLPLNLVEKKLPLRRSARHETETSWKPSARQRVYIGADDDDKRSIRSNIANNPDLANILSGSPPPIASKKSNKSKKTSTSSRRPTEAPPVPRPVKKSKESKETKDEKDEKKRIPPQLLNKEKPVKQVSSNSKVGEETAMNSALRKAIEDRRVIGRPKQTSVMIKPEKEFNPRPSRRDAGNTDDLIRKKQNPETDLLPHPRNISTRKQAPAAIRHTIRPW